MIATVRSLLLAKIAGPSNLGVVAAVVAFTSAAGLLSDSGLRSYLIHRGTSAASDARLVKKIAAATGIGATALLVVLSPALAQFYNDDRVVPVTLAMAITVLVPALTAVPGALMRLGFRFQELAMCQILGEIIGLTAGLIAVSLGHTLGALVVGSVAAQVASGAFLYVTYRRNQPAQLAPEATDAAAASWRRILEFGATVSAGGLVWLLALQGDNVAVGRLLGAGQLGLYAFAFSYGTMPGALTSSVVADIAAPSLALNTIDRIPLYRELTVVSAAILAPVTAVALECAAPAVRVVLGHEWVGAIGPLRVMLILGFVRAVFPTPSLLRAFGRVRVEPLIGLVGGPLTVVAAVVLANRGLVPIAIGVVLVAFATEIVAVVAATTSEPKLRASILRAPIAAMATSALVVGTIEVMGSIVSLQDWLRLFVVAPVALALSLAASIYPKQTREVLRKHEFGRVR